MIWTIVAPSPTEAFRAAYLLWGIGKDDLLAKCREERLVKQRWIVMNLLNGIGFSHAQIADEFCCHPSTVTYGLHQHLAQTDAEYIENNDALIDMHDQLTHGYDPHPKTAEGCYRDYPNDWYGKIHCPHMGGFSDYNEETYKPKGIL